MLNDKTNALLLDLCKKDAEYKIASELMLKLVEEVGELAVEIQIAEQVFGSTGKEGGKDGIEGEVADVIIAALAVYLVSLNRRHNDLVITMRLHNLKDVINKKLHKWREQQEKEINDDAY